MKEFLEYIIKEIVTKPESIEIDEGKEGGIFIYKIRAAEEDMGLLIGKEGRTIKSIKNMAKAKAIKDDVRISVILEESNSLQNDQI
ncbi:MAG: KH domain-containing protein [Patescibacteria group bacterium]|nr:KH domain-containing protein [Patescibacteria group bacterium]MBU1952800.1 KH domain-containing protein [Patescibacteria group bacterium]